jgi:protoporphyrinogen oxidase
MSTASRSPAHNCVASRGDATIYREEIDLKRDSYILGGGVTGLAAGWTSGLPVLEAADSPGGICSSYYVRPGGDSRLAARPADGEAYRFEVGGGHWIFGGDRLVLQFMKDLAPMREYERRSSVFFCNSETYVDFPLQNNLRGLDPGTISQALSEMARPGARKDTLREWLRSSFGTTLCELFFFPFHRLYTADLDAEIAPQDAYKSPVDLSLAIRGAFQESAAVGYNTTFTYPLDGLDHLTRQMAGQCRIRYGCRVVRIDLRERCLELEDGTQLAYDRLLSTLPLDRMMALTGLRLEARPDPHTSVLVLNIGAERGPRCPDDHWIYVPESVSGFHRVGYYSNVESAFLPAASRANGGRVGIYVERAFRGGDQPSAADIQAYATQVVDELRAWGHIGAVEVLDPTWIDVAYTWTWPGSRWAGQAIDLLGSHHIYQVGRYGRWVFQGIADSIRDGFMAGASVGVRR